MGNLPDVPRSELRDGGQRRLSSQEFELVIRRAAELQARATEEGGDDGISEAEVVRIGRELGLSGPHLERALAEVHARTPPEGGLLYRLYGPASVRSSRAVPGETAAVRQLLERYLLDREFMVVVRRFPDRTLYARGEGLVAAVGRATRGFLDRAPRLKLALLEVGVRQLDEGVSHVTLATSLARSRVGTAAGATAVGGGAGAAVAVALGIAIAPPLALAGLPVLGGALLGSRRAYAAMVERAQLQLESLLDRLEHGEIVAPPPRRTFPR